MQDVANTFFSEGFLNETQRVEELALRVTRTINLSKPPLLLLHGYPQSRIMWHRVASALSKTFSLVIPDLRGYGESDKPAGDAEHVTYSKRKMAADVAALMSAYGFKRFAVAGHDRGARVTHRLCLDYPERVTRACVIDITPTKWTLDQADNAFARAYYHWYFLQQPAPFPERLIGGDPALFVTQCLDSWSKGNLAAFDPQAIAAYCERFTDPATVHATCEDYRAAMTSDYRDDTADTEKRITCPLLCLWGRKGFVGQSSDVLAVWREHATEVEGAALDCGHFPAEELPEETLEHLQAFFAG